MTTATVPTSTIPSQDLLDAWRSIYGPDGYVNQHTVALGEVVRLIGLGSAAKQDILLLGGVGVAKTYLFKLVLKTIEDARLFSQLLLKDQTADDVIGPRSLQAYKQDRIERVIDGFLPTAHLGVVEEWSRGNATTLNGLLDLTEGRYLRVGSQTHDCSQLLMIGFTSNELPDREDLKAITDRIAIKKYVEAVTTPEQRSAVRTIQRRNRRFGIPAPTTQLTLAQWERIQQEVTMIDIPITVDERINEILSRFDSAGFVPSPRKVGQTEALIQASAWAAGRSEAKVDDILIAADTFWNLPDQARKAEDIVVDLIGGFARDAKVHQDALEPLMKKLQDGQAAVQAAGGDQTAMREALKPVYELLTDLHELRDDTKGTIERARKAGYDTTKLDVVVSDIEKADTWAQEVFFS